MAHHAEIRSSRASQTSTSEVGLALMAQTLTISLAKTLLMEGAPSILAASAVRIVLPRRAEPTISRAAARSPAFSAAALPRLPAARYASSYVPATRSGKPWVSSEVTRWRAVSHPEPRQSAQQPVCSVQVWWEQCVRRVWARHSKPMGWNAQLVLGAGHRGHGEATQHHSQVQ